MPSAVKKRYFELIWQGLKGARRTSGGVSTSCGSLWFLDAGAMLLPDPPVSPRFLTQDDRIVIADGLHAGHRVTQIVASIGKSYQSVYREIRRNSKPDGRTSPGGRTTKHTSSACRPGQLHRYSDSPEYD